MVLIVLLTVAGLLLIVAIALLCRWWRDESARREFFDIADD